MPIFDEFDAAVAEAQCRVGTSNKRRTVSHDVHTVQRHHLQDFLRARWETLDPWTTPRKRRY